MATPEPSAPGNPRLESPLEEVIPRTPSQNNGRMSLTPEPIRPSSPQLFDPLPLLPNARASAPTFGFYDGAHSTPLGPGVLAHEAQLQLELRKLEMEERRGLRGDRRE